MDDIRRRDLIKVIGGAALVWPLGARAQQKRCSLACSQFRHNRGSSASEAISCGGCVKPAMSKTGTSISRKIMLTDMWTDYRLLRRNSFN